MQFRYIYPLPLLRLRTLTAAWDELDQRVIDVAVRQWCTHLRVCVKAKDRHFKHRLSP